MGEGICRHGANPFIEKFFKDCIYDSRDMLGFGLGLASILCWMFAQLPQLVKNYKAKSADALSPVFIAEWLLGDTFNLVGALLKGDQPTTIVLTAQYFICMDCVLLLQYLYYTSLARRREKTYILARRRDSQHRQQHPHHHHHHHHHASRLRTVTTGIAATTILVLSGGGHLHIAKQGVQKLDTTFNRRRSLLATAAEQRVGSVLGYISSVLYLSSRAFQIVKNFKRRSVKGLALSMFCCAIAANTLYGSSALIRSRTTEELWSSLPWIIGSLGTVFLDAAIMFQGFVYGEGPEPKPNSSDEEEGLLSGSDHLHNTAGGDEEIESAAI